MSIVMYVSAQRGRCLLYDALASFTVLSMCVPQSLAYGQLTGLGAVFGIYTTTFPLFIYFVLGTSRQLSLGVLMCRIPCENLSCTILVLLLYRKI